MAGTDTSYMNTGGNNIKHCEIFVLFDGRIIVYLCIKSLPVCIYLNPHAQIITRLYRSHSIQDKNMNKFFFIVFCGMTVQFD